MVDMWTEEYRRNMQQRINEGARELAQSVGGFGAVVIVFFKEGNDHFHLMEGGRGPIPPAELYGQLLQAYTILDASNGEDVRLQ